MRPFTFTFNGRNSEEFGILATSYDFLMPTKRERKQFIPFRHGRYDYGARWYDERELRIRCVWMSLANITRDDMREAAFWLSEKGKITFPVEPEKYYIGELYDSSELIMHYNYALEGMPTTDGEFELNFICEPFAYREIASVPISGGINQIAYKGTAGAEPLLILRNDTQTPINGVQVVLVRRK